MYASTTTGLYVANAIAKTLSKWKPANDAPAPDLGILDLVVGTSSQGGGAPSLTGWLNEQLNTQTLKTLSATCDNVYTSIQLVNLASVSYSTYGVEQSQGKYKVVEGTDRHTIVQRTAGSRCRTVSTTFAAPSPSTCHERGELGQERAGCRLVALDERMGCRAVKRRCVRSFAAAAETIAPTPLPCSRYAAPTGQRQRHG